MSEKPASKRTPHSQVHSIKVVFGVTFLLFALIFGGYEFYLATNNGLEVPGTAWVPLTALVLGMAATGAAFLGVKAPTKEDS